MQLKIFCTKQKEKEDCGLACLEMLLNYYNIFIEVAELKKEIKVYQGIGTFSPQIGCYLLKKGFKVEIVSLNQHIFTCKNKLKSKINLIEHFSVLLEQEKNYRNKKSLLFFLEFIKLGGKININIPSEKDIQKEIYCGRPVITSITSKFLTSESPGFNFHFNLITGIDNKYIYVNDPLPGKLGGKKKHPIHKYMYAIYSTAYASNDNAIIMKIIKK